MHSRGIQPSAKSAAAKSCHSASFVGRKVEYFCQQEQQFGMAIQKEGGRGSPEDSKPWRSPYNVEQPLAAYFWGRNSSSSTGGRVERSETPTEVKCLRTCVLKFQLAFNSTKMPEDFSLVLTLLLVSIYKQLKAYPSLLISQEL